MISSMSTTRISTSSSSSSIPTGACWGGSDRTSRRSSSAPSKPPSSARALWVYCRTSKSKILSESFCVFARTKCERVRTLLLASHNRPQKKSPGSPGLFLYWRRRAREGNMYSCSLPSRGVSKPAQGRFTHARRIRRFRC